MRHHNVVLGLKLGLLLIWLTAMPAAGQFQDVVAHLPTSGNTLILIDVARIYGSPLAQREHWQADHARGVSAGGILLPPGTLRLSAAANLDLEFLEPLWEAGVLKVAAVPPLDSIAKAERGTLDDFNGHQALIMPNDSCVVAFDAEHLGVMTPASRQRVAQWLSFDPEKSGAPLAGYLAKAVKSAALHPAGIVLALNLQHAVSPADIKIHVAEWTGERLSGVTPEQLASMLASLEGATIEVHIGESMRGRLKVDFADDVSRLAPIAHDLVLETLAGSGAMVPELRDWTVRTEPRAIVLEGPASPRAVERALSIIQLPLAPVERATATLSAAAPIAAAAADGTGSSEGKPAAARLAPADAPPAFRGREATTPKGASANYFHAIRRLLGDLKEDKKDAASMGQIGLWYDTYARKIDMLPQARVDVALLDYGVSVATNLRSAAGAIKQGAIDAHQREMQITPLNTMTIRYSRPSYGGYNGYGRYGSHRGYNRYGYARYGYGRYGGVIGTYYFQSRNVSSERRKARADERAKMAKSVVGILSEIDADTAKVRQQMIEKYGSIF